MSMACDILAHHAEIVTRVQCMADHQPSAGRRPQVPLTRLPLPVAAGGGASLPSEAAGALRDAERRVKACRADDATRITLVLLARLIDWRGALTIVKPGTLIKWHRKGFRLFWRWKSKARGRPPLPVDVRRLIAAIARANVTWREERIAAELQLKLGIHSGIWDR